MGRCSLLAFLAAVTVASSVTVTLTSRARADDPAPTAERLRSAAIEFDAGRRAYLAGDFVTAAVHFENAFQDAPRAESLRSAIRAHRSAKQLARAASLASVARARYESDATTVALANEVLDDAAVSLHEVRIACIPECGVVADGRAISLGDAPSLRFFLDSGHHEVAVSWRSGRSTLLAVDARAGGKDAFTMSEPSAKGAPVGVAPAPARPLAAVVGDTRAASRKPLSPVFFVVGASLTAIAAGAAVVSGVDAVNRPGVDVVRQRCVGLGEACPEYQQGLDAQLRTNILFAATGAMFVGTAVVGLFFTHWSSPTTVPPKRTAPKAYPYPTASAGGVGFGVTGSF